MYCMDVLDIAKYFIYQGSEEKIAISNMKLQKLLYYAQGYNLALHNTPLFKEDLEKWPHGPVVRQVYHTFKDFGSENISIDLDIDFSIYDVQTKELLDDVFAEYGHFPASTLRNFSHQESPWLQTPDGAVIKRKDIKKHFKSRLLEE